MRSKTKRLYIITFAILGLVLIVKLLLYLNSIRGSPEQRYASLVDRRIKIEAKGSELVVKKPILGKNPINENYALYRPRAIEFDAQGNLYVLDSGNNRIMKYNCNFKFVKQIGRVGQGPGEFINPYDFAVGKTDKIYVVNSGNGRVEIMDKDGRFINSFRISQGDTRIAVDSAGLIYLNLPAQGDLVSVYTEKGKKVRTIGRLIQFEDPLKTSAFNKVVFTFDHCGYLWVFYESKPFLEKYDMSGNLIFRKKIEGPLVDDFLRFIDKEIRVKQASSDALVTFSFIRGVTVLKNGNLLIGLAETVCELSPDGKVLRKFFVKYIDRPGALFIDDIEVNKDGEIFDVSSGSCVVQKYIR